MYPPPFDYSAPASLSEALSLLRERPGARVVSGGMSLIPLMKMRLLSPEMVVDIGKITGLDAIEDGGGHVGIGALVRHARTATDPAVLAHAEALATASATVGDVQIRNRGTTCGALAHADAAGDPPGAALALGATMVVRSAGGRREIPAADFFVDAFTTALQPDEVLVEVRIPKAGPGEASAYEKLGRRGGTRGFAVVGAAAWVRKAEGVVADARIAVSGVGTRPALAPGVSEALIGTDGSPRAVERAASRVVEGVTFLADLYGPEDYKAHLARTYAARALRRALDTA